MIIKSKSIKSKRNLSNVLRYILVGHDIVQEGFVMCRGISGDRMLHRELEAAQGDPALGATVLDQRIENMHARFIGNNERRSVPHARANIAYHEIISFHSGDSEKLSKKALLGVARTYAKLRAPNSLVVATPHRNKDHLHIHIIISAVEFSGRVRRLSRTGFRELKQKMERYQERHLGLEHSGVDHSRKSPSLKKDAEYQLELRTGQLPEKQRLLLDLSECYAKAHGPQAFFRALEQKGHTLYQRNGRIVGIQGKRKYRLKGLGYPMEKIMALGRDVKKERRLGQLEHLRKKRSKDLGRER